MSDSVLSASHLGKTIRGKTILRDICVEASSGNVVGVIGKNGAGKTTLLDILLGFSPPTSGTSSLFGHPSFTLPPTIKKKIGYVPQQDELVNGITGAQQLSLTASLCTHWNRALIDRLSGVWEVPLDRRTETLSGGERQKLSTLLALGHEPELLILDEPVSSLDPVARRQFLQQLLEIAADQARTVLFSSHIVSDLERVANQIWIVRDGALVWHGDLDSLKESVVRLSLRARKAFPDSLNIANALTYRSDGVRATVVVSDWSAAKEAELAHRLDADIEIENLSLEDIFVELHA